MPANNQCSNGPGYIGRNLPISGVATTSVHANAAAVVSGMAEAAASYLKRGQRMARRVKQCKWCDVKLERKRGESWERFKVRQYCCGHHRNLARAAAKAKTLRQRFCKLCGDPIVRNPREAATQFRRRKFCCTEHANEAKAIGLGEDTRWRPGDPTQAEIEWWKRKLYNEQLDRALEGYAMRDGGWAK